MRFLILMAAAAGLAAISARAADPVVYRQLDGPVELRLIRFDRSRTVLRVIDLGGDQTVAQAARARGALAAVNGGYFKPGREPLGLVVSGGEVLHPMEQARILTGVFAVTPRGASLLRAGEFKLSSRVREALQSGPFLVDRGAAVAGLNAVRRDERTVLLADRRGVAALLTTAPVTLAELGRILATPGQFGDLKIERALNLDGGSSTALWVAGGEISRPEWKPVCNAVAVMPRE